MNEVVNSMAPRVQPGDEIRPRNRALRRHRGAKRLKAPHLLEPGQVGQAAFVDEAASQGVIHAVDADHDHALLMT